MSELTREQKKSSPQTGDGTFSPPMWVFVFLFVQQARVLDRLLVRITPHDSYNKPEMLWVRDSNFGITAAKDALLHTRFQWATILFNYSSHHFMNQGFFFCLHTVNRWNCTILIPRMKKKINEKEKKRPDCLLDLYWAPSWWDYSQI